MFNQVLENWYRMVEATVEAQHEVLWNWAGVWPAPLARQANVPELPSKPGVDRSSGVPGLNQAELEELKEALVAYENAEGDWSKSR
jgi:hypothetical protein